MAVLDKDIKLLWARAAGLCSHPDCDEELTVLVESGGYTVGEMAHVISTADDGPRSDEGEGSDKYDNLILLCPTHHRHIDKSPSGTFPAVVLRRWKQQHEEWVRSRLHAPVFSSFSDLAAAVRKLLSSNKVLFDALGPLSEVANRDPASNLATVWHLRRLDRILPNNQKIVSLCDSNASLLSAEDAVRLEAFRLHAEAYEQHVLGSLDNYPLFPKEFARAFGA